MTTIPSSQDGSFVAQEARTANVTQTLTDTYNYALGKETLVKHIIQRAVFFCECEWFGDVFRLGGLGNLRKP